MSKTTMTPVKFLKESLRNLKTVGTITRSSKYVCQRMIRPIDFSKAINVIELGAGDGVITRHILNKMSADSKLFVFEVNDSFVKRLDLIKDPRLHVVHASAELMEEKLKELGVEEVDYIISALPFVVFPDDLANKIVEKSFDMLKMGGTYIQIHYSLMLKKMYARIFGNVHVRFVPLNIPPAFILVSNKTEAA
jgi:phospholipid N-methyltransferase